MKATLNFAAGDKTGTCVDFSDSFTGFIWHTSGRHQLWLTLLSGVVFGLMAIPIEIQRRIVNSAVKGGEYSAILTLVEIYLAVALASGLSKLILNVYRNWVGETVIRVLRRNIDQQIGISPNQRQTADVEGVEISLIVAESEPVGQFVGTAASEPVLQGCLLLFFFGYMTYLQPIMALLVLVVLLPQFIFVPLMQGAINRRAAARIIILRGVSIAIVEDPAAIGDPQQRQRFDEAFELNLGIYKLKFSMNFMMNFMRQLGICGILALGAWLVVNGSTEIGTIVAFISGLNEINDHWGELVNWFRDMRVANVKYHLIAESVKDLGRSNPGMETA